MKHKDCIFVDEGDCPKEKINLTCADCLENKSYDVIGKAVKDFTALGDSFTDIFELFKRLMDHDGKTVEILTPTDSIFVINRVMTAMLSTNDELTKEDRIYKRLIFYFFNILVDEFKEEEYKVDRYVH